MKLLTVALSDEDYEKAINNPDGFFTNNMLKDLFSKALWYAQEGQTDIKQEQIKKTIQRIQILLKKTISLLEQH